MREKATASEEAQANKLAMHMRSSFEWGGARLNGDVQQRLEWRRTEA